MQVDVSIFYLEMTSPDDLISKHCDDGQMKYEASIKRKSWQINQRMYLEVGEPYGWYERRSWTEDKWQTHAAQPELRTFVFFVGMQEAGYTELVYSDDPAIGTQISYFGLLPEFVGQGLGSHFLTRTIETAWRGAEDAQTKPSRVWLHTCSLDHRYALKNYLARGFKLYETKSKQVEVPFLPPDCLANSEITP